IPDNGASRIHQTAQNGIDAQRAGMFGARAQNRNQGLTFFVVRCDGGGERLNDLLRIAPHEWPPVLREPSYGGGMTCVVTVSRESFLLKSPFINRGVAVFFMPGAGGGGLKPPPLLPADARQKRQTSRKRSHRRFQPTQQFAQLGVVQRMSVVCESF